MEKVVPLEPIEPIIFAYVTEAERKQTEIALREAQEARKTSNKPRPRKFLWRRLKSKQLDEAS